MTRHIGKKFLFIEFLPSNRQPIRCLTQPSTVSLSMDVFQLRFGVLAQPFIQHWLQLLQLRRVFSVEIQIMLHCFGIHTHQQPVNRFKSQRRII